MAVNGIEIAVGQVWRCRDGKEREIVYNDGHPEYPWDLRLVGGKYNDGDDGSVGDDGCEYAPTMTHKRDLIELIRDEHGFTIWKGGPVAPVSGMVEYRLRVGSTLSRAAESLGWDHDGGPADIVAYKVLSADSAEPQPNNADADRLASELLTDLGWRFEGGTWVQDEPVQTNPLDVQVGGSHYKNLAIQPIEYIHANGIGFAEGSVIKYVTRWRDKNGVKDLEKARHFIDLLIALEQRKEAAK